MGVREGSANGTPRREAVSIVARRGTPLLPERPRPCDLWCSHEHPDEAYAHLHRDVPVIGDARNDARRALAAFEARRPGGATWAICLRRSGVCEGLSARGWRRERDFGGVTVLVRRDVAVAGLFTAR